MGVSPMANESVCPCGTGGDSPFCPKCKSHTYHYVKGPAVGEDGVLRSRCQYCDYEITSSPVEPGLYRESEFTCVSCKHITGHLLVKLRWSRVLVWFCPGCGHEAEEAVRR